MHHVLYMYMSFIFARFFCLCALFSVSVCVLCFLLWAASYYGLMPSLAACHCDNMYVMYMYLVNKLSLKVAPCWLIGRFAFNGVFNAS